MSRRHDVQDPTGRVETISGRGTLQAWGAGAPTGTVGFAPGCLYHDTTNGVLYQNSGTNTAAVWQRLTTTAGTSLRTASGVASVTGTGDVATGLTTVVAVVATLQDDAALTGSITTATVGDQAGTPAKGSVTLKVWKPTSSTDPTPIASSAAKSVNWIAVGT
jgi:hypothetical protein